MTVRSPGMPSRTRRTPFAGPFTGGLWLKERFRAWIQYERVRSATGYCRFYSRNNDASTSNRAQFARHLQPLLPR